MNIYMNRAVELAEKAFSLGEVPVGASIGRKNKVIGEGYNLRESSRDALAHAEIIAINQACRNLGGWRLPECEIYITLEPCPMCCGAIINARIDNVFFGAYDKKSGSAVSVQRMFDLPYNYRPEITGGIMQEQCSELLSRFFRELRQKQKKIPAGIDDIP